MKIKVTKKDGKTKVYNNLQEKTEVEKIVVETKTTKSSGKGEKTMEKTQDTVKNQYVIIETNWETLQTKELLNTDSAEEAQKAYKALKTNDLDVYYELWINGKMQFFKGVKVLKTKELQEQITFNLACRAAMPMYEFDTEIASKSNIRCMVSMHNPSAAKKRKAAK